MKTFGRILLKIIILLLVVCIGAGGAIGWRYYQRSQPGYVMDQYLRRLIDGDSDRAFELLDQSEDAAMTKEEYAEALEGKQYSLSAEYTAEELEERLDENGNQYVDFHVQFRDAADEPQAEEDFVVRKQPQPAFGVFDQWKVLSAHCMVKDFEITVPTGSEVYLDGVPADASWIVRDGVPYSCDRYRIPSLIPGRVDLVIRHPALESVNTILDTAGESQDYSAQMTWKRTAQDECKELGITALKQLYAAAVKESTDGLELFEECSDTAEKFVSRQGKKFHQDGSVFQNVAISEFSAQIGDPVYAEGEDSSIMAEVALTYHYLVRRDVTTDTEELQEDGTPVQTTERVSEQGDNTATLQMAFRDGEWKITSIKVPVLLKNKE